MVGTVGMEPPKEKPPDFSRAEAIEDLSGFPEMEPLREKVAGNPRQANIRVFVSHSHQDNDFCVKVVDDLRTYFGNDGDVWYDAVGLHGGDAWWRKIVAEVKARNVFIVVLSPDAMESPWVHDEIDLAWKLKNSPAGMLIIPLLWRACEIRDDLETRQIISFLSPRQYETAFQELVRALENTLLPKSSYPPSGLPSHYFTPTPRPARQIPPIWMPSGSQMHMDLPDIEDIAHPSSTPDEDDLAPPSEYPYSDIVAKVPDDRNVWGRIEGVPYPAITVPEIDPPSETEIESRYDESATIIFMLAKINDYIGWFAVIFEIMLLTRVIFRLIGADPNNFFVAIVYGISGIFLLPFSNMLSNATFSQHFVLEWATLVAMAIYWVIFWGMRRFLRLLIASPEPIE